MPTPKETTTLPTVPDGVYSTFVKIDGVRYERCLAQVRGRDGYERIGHTSFPTFTVCENPTDGGRFCLEHTS